MAHSRTSFRSIITRGLALMAMLCIYGFGLIGTSALMLGASAAPAQARGGGAVVVSAADSAAAVSAVAGFAAAASAAPELASASVWASPHPITTAAMATVDILTAIPAITTRVAMWSGAASGRLTAGAIRRVTVC